MEEYKDIMKEMYAQICDFVVNNPDIEHELVDREREFLRLSFSECNPRQLFFDWFVFDHILNKYRVRLFDFYLRRKKKSIPKILYDVYLKIGGDRFSFFKIKAVKIGKQFLCQDILTGKEYQVFESSLTKSIGKGDYIIGRLLPFAEAFILASQCLCYKSQDYDMFSLVMKNAVPAAENRIDPYDVYKTLYPQNIPEKLPVEEKFTLLCKEGGLSDDDIEDIFLSIRIAVKDKNTPPQQVIPGVIEKMKEQEWFSMEEFYQAFVNVWNSFAEQIHPVVRKGPIEISLINVCMDVLGEKFLLPPNMSEKGKNDFSMKIQRWSDQWFVTPKEELNGKTPKEVIMLERAELGNPQKDFGFQFNAEYVEINPQKEKKAEKLFNAGVEHARKGEYQEALKSYQDYLKVWDENHVVWHNMGICYVMLLQKRKAEKCFKKALMIKPDYKLAYNKWEELVLMNKEEMVQMVKKIRN